MTVLIAGGGVAGAAAACLLGPEATLVERESESHDKICGEFVSWEAQDALAALGVDVHALGGAAIRAVRLVHGARTVTSALPAAGAGLSRRVLDEALLARASRAGATIIRGHTVRRVFQGGLEVERLGRLEGRRVLLATGKHDLRGVDRRGRPGDLVGLKMYYRFETRQSAELDGHVEVVLFRGGYAGLQHVEGGRVNLCLLIRRAAFAAAGGCWAGVVELLCRTAPHLARRLAGAEELLARPVTIYRVPYGFVHRPSPADIPGVVRLGDQMGVVPSFSGDGMAIALHTAFAAARPGEPSAYHRRMRSDLSGQVGRAMTLHRIGLAAPGPLVAAARAWPGALAMVARLTRVPPRRRAFEELALS